MPIPADTTWYFSCQCPSSGSSGAADLNPPKWLQAWDPQLVLLSVGAGDRQARLAAEVLQAVEDCTLMHTDQNGWVRLSTDGEQMWVEAERH